MAKITGGGIQGNKNVSVGQRLGSPSKGSSPGAADQIGQSTAFNKEKVDAGRGYDGAKYGNELATNVGKGGPGTGRTLYGQCGTQGTHGEVVGKPRPESRDVLSQYGPDIPGRK
jgi:hypothetical protein